MDPFSHHNDAELWAALSQASMKTCVANIDNKLEHVMQEGGKNFSVGQRQYVLFHCVIIIVCKYI